MFRRSVTPAKTAEQLVLMRRAGLLVAKALDAVQAHVRAGVTTLELDTVAEDYIRSHLSSARQRKVSLIIKDITRITAAFDRVEAAFKALPEDAEPSAFKALTAELIELNKAVYAAYTDQPVEADAWEAGNAVYEAFNKAFAAAPVP